jgi:TonB-dependent receptor
MRVMTGVWGHAVKPVFSRLVLAGCLLFTSGLFAQNVGSLRISVNDQDWQAPINEAQVTLVEKNLKQVTNLEGETLFENLESGRYTFSVGASGFERKILSSVVVIAGRVETIECTLQAMYTDMDEFVIKDLDLALGNTDIAQLNLRSQSSSFMDNLGSDFISRAGASTAAAAMRMVTGANVQDGKYVVIRGLGDRYTATLLNGVRLPTSDKDKRAVQLDQFPSAMIESIQVSKTFTPDQQGDASGGTINIVTKGVPAKTVLQASVSMEYDTQATGNGDFKTIRGGGNALGGMQGLGHYPSSKPDGMDTPRGDDVTRSATIHSKEPFANYGFKGAVGDVYTLGDTWKIGTLLYGSLTQKYRYLEGERHALQRQKAADAIALEPGDYKTTETSTDEQLWNVGFTVGAKSEANEIKLTGTYTHQAREIINMRYEDLDPSTVTTNSKTRAVTTQRLRNLSTLSQYSENSNASLQLTGRHLFESLADLELDWTGAYSYSESTEPDRQLFTGAYEDKLVVDRFGNVQQDYSRLTGNLERRWQDIREDSLQLQLNAKQPFRILDNEGYLKGGLFLDSLTRTYRNRIYGQGATISATDEYDFSGFESVFNGGALGDPTQFSTDYDGQQDILAYYAMARLPLPEWLDIIGGVRAEGTHLETEVWSSAPNMQGNVFLTQVVPDARGINVIRKGELISEDEAGASIDQVDLLPALSLNFKRITDVSIRLAYSETIARPTFKELTPVEYTDDDPERAFIGNQDLELSNLRNYDARVEWRPDGQLDMVALSFFYKTIRNPIQYTAYADPAPGSDKMYIFPENYGDAWIGGIELEARKGLDFIWDDLRDLSLGGNFTVQDSYVEYMDSLKRSLRQAGSNASGRRMDGQPDYLANLNLVYQNDDLGLMTGLFYNFKGELYSTGEAAQDGFYTPHIIDKPTGSFDYTISWKFYEHWRIGFEVKNILNPFIERAYRSPSGDLPYTSYRVGRTFSIGLGYEW